MTTAEIHGKKQDNERSRINPLQDPSVLSRTLYHYLFPETPEGLFINLLIYALFTFGVLRTWGLMAAVRAERKHVNYVRNILAHAETEGQEAPQVVTLAELRERTGLVQIDPAPVPNTAIGKRIHALWGLRGSGSTGAEAIAAVYESRQDLTLELPRYFTSILVLLGLAGTVAGLRGIITQLNSTLSGAPSDPAVLLGALQPMQSAFSCTLAGIVTSIILAFFLTRLDTSLGGLLAETEELVTLRLMPLIFPATETAQLHKMNEILEGSQHFLEDFGRTIGESRDFFAETLGTAVRGAAQELQKTLGEATNALEQSMERMQGTATSLGQSAESIIHYRAELESERNQILGHLKANAEQLLNLGGRVLTPLQTAAEGLAASRTSIEAIAVDSEAERETLRNQMSEVVNHIDTLAKAVDQERKVVAGMGTEMQKALAVSAQDFSRRLDESAGESRRVAETLNALLRQIHPEAMVMPNGEVLGDALVQLTQEIQQVSNNLKTVSDRIDSVSETIDNRSGAMANQTSAMNAQIQALLTAITLLTNSDNRKQMREVLEMCQKSLASGETLMRSSQTETQSLNRELKQIRSYLQEPIWKHVLGSRDGRGERNGT